MKSAFFLMFYLIASIHAMEPINQKENQIKLDEEGQKEFKSGIDQMALNAKKLTSEPRRAAKYYELLSAHLAQGGFSAFFDTHKEHIKALYEYVSLQKDYQREYKKACENPKDEGLWNQWRSKIAAVLTQNYCQDKGVKFPQQRDQDYLYEFLFLNNNISTQTQPWLGTGSYSLYLFRQIQREKTGSVPPLPWDK